MRLNKKVGSGLLQAMAIIILSGCATNEPAAPTQSFEGVVGVVLTPHDMRAYQGLGNLVAVGLREVSKKGGGRVSLNALFPESHGEKSYLGQIPVGTYALSEFGFRVSEERTRWIEIDEGELRFSVLPGTLTNLGEMAFLVEGFGTRSRVSVARLGNDADIGQYVRRHPFLNEVELEEARGWDDPEADWTALEAELRATASAVGRPVSTGHGFDLMPTMLGDFVVRNRSGQWGRVRGHGRGYISRIRTLEDGQLLVSGASGIHLGHVSDSSTWEKVAIDPAMDSVLDTTIVSDRLFALVEERRKTATNRTRLEPRSRLIESASISLVSMPWPNLDSISVLRNQSMPTDSETLGDAVMTTELAVLPLGDDDYAWQSLSRQEAEGVIGDIERLHTQGRYLFMKSSLSTTWTYVVGDDVPGRRDLDDVRALQPPVALPGGELLIYGRIIDGRQVSSIGYYSSNDGGATWDHWSNRATGCGRPEMMYHLERRLFQFCRNGELYVSGLEEPDWTLDQRENVQWWGDFPIGSREVGL